jgi:hypothetical protein
MTGQDFVKDVRHIELLEAALWTTDDMLSSYLTPISSDENQNRRSCDLSDVLIH